MKTGARRGPWSELMKAIVTSMSVPDMAAVSAFAAATPAPVAVQPTSTTAAR
jgi:cytochrome c553